MTDLDTKIEDAKVEGWDLYQREGDRAIMVNRRYGSWMGHLIIALLTIWWTFGVGNVLYAAYMYFMKPDRRVIRNESNEWG